MKKTTIKLIALVVVSVMLACMFCSCGGNKMNITVGIKLGDDYINYQYDQHIDDEEFMIPSEDRVFLNDVPIEIAYDEGAQVSALDAFINACVEYDLEYTLDEAGQSFKAVRSYQGFSGKDAEGTIITFFWTYTINGVEPTERRANTKYSKDGDVIVFSLVSASANDFDGKSY